MSPNFISAGKKLSYPLYCAEFDPLNPDFLLVGGGGGSSSSGVPNKISLIDVSRPREIREVADIELAKNEDSVSSLAVATSDVSSLTAYAGINSSEQDKEKGKNEHFRSFRIALPKKRKADTQDDEPVEAVASVQTQALSRTALFASAMSSKDETYQRLLRVSPTSSSGNRIAVIASGLAQKNEVIALRVTSSPGPSNVVSRINLESKEAADMDITTDDASERHVLAYATDYEVFVHTVQGEAAKESKEPMLVYSIPQSAQRSKIRSLRFFNSRYILLLLNRPGRTGAELVVIKTDKDYTQSKVVLNKSLTRSTKQAVGIDIGALSASPTGERQFIVAAAGQDSTIEIFTIDFLPKSGGMQKFKQYDHLISVHAGPITRLAFSKFIAPSFPVSGKTPPQFIRLASVGVDQAVIINTLPLRPYPTTQTREPQYVLTQPSEALTNAFNITIALIVVALTAFFMQAFCEIRGALPPTLHAQDWLSPAWHARIARPYIYHQGRGSGPVIPSSMPPILHPPSLSSTLSAAIESSTDTIAANIDLAQQQADASVLDSAIVIKDTIDDLTAEVHHHASDEVKDAKKWDELTDKEKKRWRTKLKEAGQWTEKQGEGVLKGVFFGQLAGIVAGAVGG